MRLLNRLGCGLELDRLAWPVWCEAGEGLHRDREGPQKTRAAAAAAGGPARGCPDGA